MASYPDKVLSKAEAMRMSREALRYMEEAMKNPYNPYPPITTSTTGGAITGMTGIDLMNGSWAIQTVAPSDPVAEDIIPI